MDPATMIVLLAMAVPLGFGALGFVGGRMHERRRFASGTLLVGIDRQRQDIELRVSPAKNNKILWGTEKAGGKVVELPVVPGEGSQFTVNGAGRGFIVNRKTLSTMRLSPTAEALDDTPEDAYQRAMYALGEHEKAIARQGEGNWLNKLAEYTPILVIGVGLVLIVGIIALSGKFHA